MQTLKTNKMTNKTRQRLKGLAKIAGALTIGAIGFALGKVSTEDIESMRRKEYLEGSEIGYAKGYTECREKIARDLDQMGIHPTIRVSDHPSIPAIEMLYFSGINLEKEK